VLEEKIPVVVRRLQEARIDRCNLFYRTSAAGRSAASFHASVSTTPNLMFQACLDALLTLKNEGVECFFADGEADPECAGLAAHYNGYVLSLDSDYVIFNARHKGYIPLDDLVWATPGNTGLSDDEKDDSEFRTVSHAKGKKFAAQEHGIVRGLIPPPKFSSLTVSTYRPETLAATLRLSIGLLPLLASVLGNDFTPPTLPYNFFPKGMAGPERVRRAALMIRAAVNPPKYLPPHRRAKARFVKSLEGADKVTQLIGTVVTELALRDDLTNKEFTELTDSIRDSIFHYIVPDDFPGPGPLSDPELLQPRNEQQRKVQRRFLRAYRRGEFSSDLMGYYATGTAWPHLNFEDPDVKASQDVVGGPVREWTYAVLAHGLDGVGREHVDASTRTVENDDELIDVEEEMTDSEHDFEASELGADPRSPMSTMTIASAANADSTSFDPLIALRNQLEGLKGQHLAGVLPPNGHIHAKGEIATSSTSPLELEPMRPSGPRFVTEYIRRGARLVPVKVLVRDLADLITESEEQGSTYDAAGVGAPPIDFVMSIQLHSADTRLSLLLYALHANTTLIRDLPNNWIFLAASLRWTIIASSTRLPASNAKGVYRGKWSASEVKAFIASCDVRSADTSPQYDTENDAIASHSVAMDPSKLNTRTIQLTALILAGIENVLELAHALLVREDVLPASGAARAVSGIRFHQLVSQLTASKEAYEGVFGNIGLEGREKDIVFGAVIDGLQEHLGEETWQRQARIKKDKLAARSKENKVASSAPAKNGGKNSKKGGSMFDILAALGAD